MSWASCLSDSGLVDCAGRFVADNSRATNSGTTQVFLRVSMGGDCFTASACGATLIQARRVALAPPPSSFLVRTGSVALGVDASASWYRLLALLATPTRGHSLTRNGWFAG